MSGEIRKSTGHRISDIIGLLEHVFTESDILRRDERLAVINRQRAERLHFDAGRVLSRARDLERAHERHRLA